MGKHTYNAKWNDSFIGLESVITDWSIYVVFVTRSMKSSK